MQAQEASPNEKFVTVQALRAQGLHLRVELQSRYPDSAAAVEASSFVTRVFSITGPELLCASRTAERFFWPLPVTTIEGFSITLWETLPATN